MSKRSHKSSNDERDDPPMSRLFVVCSKNNTESEFLDAFGKYGQIEDCRIVKDRDGNNKGVAYVKFSRTSEAARACEALNGQLIGQSSRPIKVLIAARYVYWSILFPIIYYQFIYILAVTLVPHPQRVAKTKKPSDYSSSLPSKIQFL